MSHDHAESAAAHGARCKQAQRQQAPGHSRGWPGQAVQTPRTPAFAAAALLMTAALVAGCTGSPASPAAKPPASSAAANCLLTPASSCYAPRQFRVAYGIQSWLDKGIDGRGETVTVVAPPPQANTTPPASTVPVVRSSSSLAAPPPGSLPGTTDILKDLAAFDRMFRLPAARIQVVTTLAGSASPWQASAEEVQDLEVVHAVAPGATLRLVRLPGTVLDSAATATTDMIAALRLAVAHTDVASIGWSLGEHFFSTAQVAELHAILRAAAAQHVTVAAGSGDNGSVTTSAAGLPVKEVGLPAADPLALAVGGTTLTANPLTGSYLRETTWNGATPSFSVSLGASGGGFSHRYARPSYQDGVPGITTMRGVPDVAGDANQQGGLPVIFGGAGNQIASNSGTSAATALWAGIIALEIGRASCRERV